MHPLALLARDSSEAVGRVSVSVSALRVELRFCAIAGAGRCGADASVGSRSLLSGVLAARDSSEAVGRVSVSVSVSALRVELVLARSIVEKRGSVSCGGREREGGSAAKEWRGEGEGL